MHTEVREDWVYSKFIFPSLCVHEFGVEGVLVGYFLNW